MTAPTWTYDSSLLTGTDATAIMMQVRRLIGDVQTGDKQFYDDEIRFFIAQRPNIYGAAAIGCRSLAAQFARKVDTVQGELRTLYSNQARSYLSMATQYDGKATIRTGVPYAGGISRADKINQIENTDRVPPQYNIGMEDNFIPVPPAGNETPTPGSGNGNGGV